MHFVVKYFPEITIKSPPVRKRFVKQLQANLLKILRPIVPDLTVKKSWDKLEVIAPPQEAQSAQQTAALTAQVSEALSNTPGIAYFAEVTLIEFDQLEDLGQQLAPIWAPLLENKTFCVRVKRSGSQNFTSVDAERIVGSALFLGCKSTSVRLKDPDITVLLEINNQQCFMFIEKRPGLGGFPLGTQGHVLSLVSGGFDSTVSSYLTTKRGLITHFCFFNLGGRSHELGVKEVSYYLWKKYSASHSVKFISVPFEGVVSEILENISNSQMGVVLKRMMLRVASRVADELDMQALVTGEAVAQVSSQTLTNLRVIDSVTESLVLRPLITTDKGDIINLSRKIGTEEFAASMPEYCGVISVKPTTKATIERITAEEVNFNWDVLEKAFEERVVVAVSAVANDLLEDVPEVRESSAANGAIIIDIRHPSEEERQPLTNPISTIEKIPFYQLNTRFPQLPADQQYLLYCDKGVMSKLHAAHLVDAGFSNVGVFRPGNHP